MALQNWCKWAERYFLKVLFGLGVIIGSEPLAVLGNAAFASSGGFNPLSVSFVSGLLGWSLGWVPCGTSGACVALRRTLNGGRTWSVEPVPASLAVLVDRRRYGRPLLLVAGPQSWLNIRFANSEDGWIFGGLPNGGPLLWSTHNGGFTWQRQPARGLSPDNPIIDVEASRSTVYLMAINEAERVVVESSPIDKDDWHLDQTTLLPLPAGGGEPSGSFVFRGGHGWLVEGNDRGVTGSAELEGSTRWVAWESPCRSVGNSYAVPAASNASDLAVICVMGGFASPLSPSAPPGASLGSSWLYFSNNVGASFYHGPELIPIHDSFGPVLAYPEPGTIVMQRAGPGGNALIVSFNFGKSWQVAWHVALPRYFSNLVFVTATDGFALVVSGPSAAGSILISTRDGGRRWTEVNF